MALDTEWLNRSGGATASFVISLTNPFAPNATTYDSAQLTRAINDVKAAFKVYAGVEYDDSATTNPEHYDEHISFGVQGVTAKLMAYTGQAAGRQEWDAWKTAIRDMAKIGARDRFFVKSSSGVTESDENPNGDTIRPEFDPQNFYGYVPGAENKGENKGGVPG